MRKLLLLLFLATDARADTVDACVAAAQEGQSLRDEGKLLRARVRLAECTAEACPAAVRKDCDRFLADVDARLPSIVVRVRRADGTDVTDARATIDDQGTVTDGRAVTLDPGRHVVLAAGQRAEILLREGEQRRMVDLALPGPPPPRVDRTRTLWGWGLLGASALALGSWAYFGLRGVNEWTDLQAGCRPRCAEGDIDGARTSFLVADVSLVAFALTAGIGAYLLVTRER
jgi:hypothetical protein